MRRAYKPQLCANESGDDSVLCLGADFCAEHEWGIGDIHAAFGISGEVTSKVFGIPARTITKVPEGLFLLENKDSVALTYESYLGWQSKRGQCITWQDISCQLKYETGESLRTAWDNKSFGMIASGGQEKAFLKRLHLAILNRDAAIWLGGGGPFQNARLCIGIASLISGEARTIMAKADCDRILLKGR